MSVQAMTWVLEHSASTGNARLVLLSIANHADRDGTNAWPAIDTIAIEARCSPATVKRSIAELRSLGELDWLRGLGREGARRKSNFYWLPRMRMQLGISRDPITAQGEPLSRHIVATTRGQRRTRVPNNGSPVSHEPSLNRPEPGFNALNINGKRRAREIIEQLASRKAVSE